MKHIATSTGTEKMLNPVGTLAAPQMLARAHRARFAALSAHAMNEMTVVGYSAQFIPQIPLDKAPYYSPCLTYESHNRRS